MFSFVSYMEKTKIPQMRKEIKSYKEVLQEFPNNIYLCTQQLKKYDSRIDLLIKSANETVAEIKRCIGESNSIENEFGDEQEELEA